MMENINKHLKILNVLKRLLKNIFKWKVKTILILLNTIKQPSRIDHLTILKFVIISLYVR